MRRPSSRYMLQFGRGSNAAETRIERHARGGLRRLQFGRGSNAAETVNYATENVEPPIGASIRPRRQVTATCYGAVAQLQFGRGSSAAETSPAARRPRRPTLQFGHGTDAVEMPCR